MEQEKIVKKVTEYSVNLAGSQVDALRVKEDLQTTVRVYDGKSIGVAGAIGNADEGALVKEAQEKLSVGIPYPCMLAEGQERTVDEGKEIIAKSDYVKTAKKLVKRLSECYPDFIFSGKINMMDEETDYANSKKTHLNYKGSLLIVSLSIKSKSSANVFDLFYESVGDTYNEDVVVENTGRLLNVYGNELEIPENVPVIIGTDIVFNAFAEMIAEPYMSGASLFNGKLGQKIFDERVNVCLDRSPSQGKGIPFFDMEGVTHENDKFYFVKDGVFSGLVTYKRSASNFNLPLSGGAQAAFDGVPSVGFRGLTLCDTAKSLKELVKGKAIYVWVTAGGDMTPDGNIGAPIMLAYLYEDGKLVGRLPEFGITGNVFDVLGKDFIGVAKNDVFENPDSSVLVARFNVNKNQ